jgi:integrase
MLAKISKSLVDKLEPGSLVWDTGPGSVGNFGVRKQMRHPRYVVRYRIAGKQRLHTIGRHGSPWTVETARKEAQRLLGIVASGVDPSATQTQAQGNDVTFAALAERYLQSRQSALKPRTFVNVTFHLRKQSLALHERSFVEIDRRAIAELLGEVERTSGPVARNRLRASLSALWTWAIAEALCETNAVSGTAKANEAPSRDRVLTVAEIRALPKEPKVFADIVLLLLLTGQRRDEIGRLEWREIDLDAGAITLPPERTKNSREHIIPLSRQAAAILQRQPRDGAFVFGRRGYANWPRESLRLPQGTRPHDLRRTAATGMAELGVLPHVIEAVLNHASGHKASVAGIYNRARYLEPMREALALWANHVEQITSVV